MRKWSLLFNNHHFDRNHCTCMVNVVNMVMKAEVGKKDIAALSYQNFCQQSELYNCMEYDFLYT